MKKLIFLLIAYLFLSVTAHAQMFTFNFTGTGTCPSTQNNSVIQPPSATVLPLSRNGTLNCTQTNDYFNTSAWSQNTSIDASQYIELTITADANSRLNLTAISFTQMKSSTGPATCRVAHNANGDFTTNTNDFAPNGSTNTVYTWDFPDFTTSIGATIKFRIYGWGAGGSTGTLRLNNLSVYGSAIINSPFSYDYTKGYVGVGLANSAVPTQRLQVDGGNISLTNGRLMVGGVDAGSMTANNYLLGVNGTAIVNKLIVKKNGLTPWPDYVFDDHYKPIPLDSLRAFIQTNRHLPEMPSSDEIEADGVDVSSSQSVLLKKIEELTLYVLAQNNQLAEQDKQIAEQRKQQQLQATEISQLNHYIKEIKAALSHGNAKHK